MLFHPLCYMKRALSRLKKYPEFSILFLCEQRYALGDTKRNALDILDFRNQVYRRMLFREYVQIHLDIHRVIIYINFGSNQPHFSLKDQLLLPQKLYKNFSQFIV